MVKRTKGGYLVSVSKNYRDSSGKRRKVRRERIAQCSDIEARELEIQLMKELDKELKGEAQKSSLTSIYNLSTSEVDSFERQCKAILGTDLAAWNYKRPECFGNLVRYATVRKHRDGVQVAKQGNVYRRLLKECDLFPTDYDGFRRRFDEYWLLLDSCEHKRIPGKNISEGSKNRILAAVKSIWEYAEAIDLVKSNPISRMRYRKKPEEARKRTLDVWEIEKLKECFEEYGGHWLQAFLFSIVNPIAYGDLRESLLTQNIDLENLNIPYTRKKTRASGVPLIHEHMIEFMRDRKQSGPGPVFILPKSNQETMAKAKRDSNVSDLVWHDFRHHAATWLVQKGFSLEMVRIIGAWKSVEMVERYHDLGELAKQMAGTGRIMQGSWSPEAIQDRLRTAPENGLKVVGA